MTCGENYSAGDETLPIRRVRNQDFDGILALARRTGVFTSDEIAVVRELVEIELRDTKQKDYRSFVAQGDGRIVGFACYGPAPMTEGTFDLYWIFVHPDHQRRAVGSLLLEEVEKAIRRAKGRMLIVDTSSTSPYLPARRFYKNHGFQRAAEVEDYYRRGDSRITYVKQIL